MRHGHVDRQRQILQLVPRESFHGAPCFAIQQIVRSLERWQGGRVCCHGGGLRAYYWNWGRLLRGGHGLGYCGCHSYHQNHHQRHHHPYKRQSKPSFPVVSHQHHHQRHHQRHYQRHHFKHHTMPRVLWLSIDLAIPYRLSLRHFTTKPLALSTP